MAGDDLGYLSPKREQEFQRDLYFAPGWRDWRRDFIKTYGGPPNTEPGGDYNYRLAWLTGAAPERDPASGLFHGLSSASVPPRLLPVSLKREDHPTLWKEEFMQEFGVNPDLAPEWTPQMRDWFNRNVLVKELE